MITLCYAGGNRIVDWCWAASCNAADDTYALTLQEADAGLSIGINIRIHTIEEASVGHVTADANVNSIW